MGIILGWNKFVFGGKLKPGIDMKTKNKGRSLQKILWLEMIARNLVPCPWKNVKYLMTHSQSQCSWCNSCRGSGISNWTKVKIKFICRDVDLVWKTNISKKKNLQKKLLFWTVRKIGDKIVFLQTQYTLSFSTY